MVTVQDPSGGVLTIYGKGTRLGSTFYSTARARQSLHHGCMGFLEYVVDILEEENGSVSISDVPIVCNFPGVFLEELPGVPPLRQVEFQNDLISGATPISNAPYHLAPPEMQELSSQLQKLLGERVYSSEQFSLWSIDPFC